MKISCLIITQLSRINLLDRSIESFSNQTINKKFLDLLIVHHDGKFATKAISKILTKYQVKARILEVSPMPLGALRNVSIDNASGDILCQWDDDDFCNPNRLKIQSAPFVNKEIIATTLDSQIYWFCNDRNVYIRKGGRDGIHGTIMFRNGQGLKYNPNMFKGEDSRLIEDIIVSGREKITCIVGHPELYVRTFHGLNTWDFMHHHSRLNQQAMQAEWLLTREDDIRKWLKVLKISSVNIRDNNSKIVFTI